MKKLILLILPVLLSSCAVMPKVNKSETTVNSHNVNHCYNEDKKRTYTGALVNSVINSKLMENNSRVRVSGECVHVKHDVPAIGSFKQIIIDLFGGE